MPRMFQTGRPSLVFCRFDLFAFVLLFMKLESSLPAMAGHRRGTRVSRGECVPGLDRYCGAEVLQWMWMGKNWNKWFSRFSI